MYTRATVPIIEIVIAGAMMKRMTAGIVTWPTSICVNTIAFHQISVSEQQRQLQQHVLTARNSSIITVTGRVMYFSIKVISSSLYSLVPVGMGGLFEAQDPFIVAHTLG